MNGLAVPSMKEFYALSARVKELEKSVAWLKRYVTTPADTEEEHTEHLWCEWQESEDVNPHNLKHEVYERVCEHPRCDEVEMCGTHEHPHKFTIHAGVHYFPPDICEVCRFRY